RPLPFSSTLRSIRGLAAWEGRGVGRNVGLEHAFDREHMRAQPLVLVMVAVAAQPTAVQLDRVVAVVPAHQRLEPLETNPLRLFGVAGRLIDHAVQRRLHVRDDNAGARTQKGALWEVSALAAVGRDAPKGPLWETELASSR